MDLDQSRAIIISNHCKISHWKNTFPNVIVMERWFSVFYKTIIARIFWIVAVRTLLNLFRRAASLTQLQMLLHNSPAQQKQTCSLPLPLPLVLASRAMKPEMALLGEALERVICAGPPGVGTVGARRKTWRRSKSITYFRGRTHQMTKFSKVGAEHSPQLAHFGFCCRIFIPSSMSSIHQKPPFFSVQQLILPWNYRGQLELERLKCHPEERTHKTSREQREMSTRTAKQTTILQLRRSKE